MNLLKRWRGHQEKDRNQSLVKHHDDHGLSRLGDFREQIDRTFDRLWREWDRDPWSALATFPSHVGALADWPAVDMAEDDQHVTLRVDVPGLDEKDLDVEVSGNTLSIRGQREDEWSDKKKGVRRRERVSGSFARTLTLPSYVNASKVEAKYAKGTLTITVPKIPGQGPRRVQITGA